MPASQVVRTVVDSYSTWFLLHVLSLGILQTTSPRPSPPQVLSEEALKEALQVPSIWVESQDVQEAKCQEVEREVSLRLQAALLTVYAGRQTGQCKLIC